MTAAQFLEELQEQQRRRALAKIDSPTEVLVESILAVSAGSPTPAAAQGPRAHRLIKLGIDVHLDRYVVVRQIDGGAPQPPQRFSPAKFLEWARQQTELAERVYTHFVLISTVLTLGGQ